MQIVEIRRNSDGVTHLYDYEFPWDGDYVWSEGNYSCDCNRKLFFHAYDDEGDFSTEQCGNGAYSIRITTPEGELLYEDDNWYRAK